MLPSGSFLRRSRRIPHGADCRRGAFVIAREETGKSLVRTLATAMGASV
jgi:hypothetical protein